MLLMFSALIAFLETVGQIGVCMRHKVGLAGRIDCLVPDRVSPALRTRQDLAMMLIRVI